MRKKNWLIGAAALAAVVTFGAFGVHSVKATETDSKSAKESIVFEQLGRNSYSNIEYGDYGMALATEDGKYYAMVDGDGTTTEIDNSDGKYEEISLISSNLFNNCMYVVDKDNKGAVLKYNGDFAYGTDKYYDYITSVDINNENMCAYIDEGKVIVKKADGTVFFEKELPDVEYSSIRIFSYANRFIGLRFDNPSPYKRAYYEFDGSDVTDKLIYNDAYPFRIAQNKDGVIKIGYGIYSRDYVYLDKDLNVIENTAEYASVGFDSIEYKDLVRGNGKVFTSPAGGEFTEDDYRLYQAGVIKGYKVTCGYKCFYKDVDTDNSHYSYLDRIVYAIFDGDNNMLLNDYKINTAYADKFVTEIKNDAGKSEYRIMKAVLTTETGVTDIKKDNDNNSIANIVAKDVDPIDIKDAEGKSLSYDDLDTDAQEVYNQKFNFSAKAADGVIADGASLSVEKVLAGKDYEAAKNVTKDVANHIAVFNINLFKEGAKIQPNGKIEFTVDVPKNFNSDLVAVYRLSEDGKSYTKLESTVKDGKVTFLTDHFSTYMIVEEKQEVVEPSKPATDNNEVADTTPGTGDVANYAIYAAAMLCAAGMLVIASKKRAK